MKIEQLTDEQIAGLTPQQVEILENNPDKLAEIIDKQEASNEEVDKENTERKGGPLAAAGEGEEEAEDEPVVFNKSGTGTIPYEKHKALRVENSSLREQLQQAQGSLDELLKARGEAGSKKDEMEADEAIAKHLESLKSEMPELHGIITTVLEGNRKYGEKLERMLQELERNKEESTRAYQQNIQEQVVEAKENNPDLVHWENSDPEAWDEALRQDEILRTSSKWANKPYAERFEEVVRRVRAIIPKASVPYKHADPEQTRVDAKAKLETATVRKPTTLSDIQGAANPASEREQIENLSPHELTKRLMQMPSHKAAALRSELD